MIFDYAGEEILNELKNEIFWYKRSRRTHFH